MDALKKALFLGLWVFSAATAPGAIVIESVPVFSSVIRHSCVSADSVCDNAQIADVRVRTTDNNGSRIKVFLIGGQSNAAGSGLNADYPALYQSPQYDVEFWNGGRLPGDGVPNYPAWDRSADTEFRPLEPGSGNYPAATHSGFEMSLGRALKDALPHDNIAIVKYGMSGSALYRGLRPDGAGDWDCAPAPLGSSFDGVRYHVFRHSAILPALQAITDRGDTYEIAGMFWMQGETDAGNLTAANAYETNLYKLINAVRTEFSAPDMRFIIGRIRTVMGTYNGTVRTAMQNVAAADPLTAWVDTDDLPVNSDNVHYSAQGLVTLGERFAAEWLTLQDAACENLLAGDINKDCYVDIIDLLTLTDYWLECTDPGNPTRCQP